MMVTWVRGLFKDMRGSMEWDHEQIEQTVFEGWMDAAMLWTGEPERDAHLRSPDFFDTDNHPDITFRGRFSERLGDNDFRAVAQLTLRGTTGEVPLDVTYQGQWATPFWVGDENRGMMHRIGFEARGRLNRNDYGVSWNDQLPGGGVVASNWIDLTIDVEAILLEDLEATGAIEYYRDIGAVPRGVRS